MTYSSSVSVSRRQFARRGQNVVKYSDGNHRLGPISNTIILIVLLCLVGLLYLTQVTKTNSYAYKISGLQKTQRELKDERTNLEVNAARLQSLERVASSEAAKKLVSAPPSKTVQ